MPHPCRGDIWWVRLDPTIGAEIKKTRPALVVSNDINNQYAGTVTVVPISDTGKKIYPFEVFLSAATTGLEKDSKARCQQIRTVDQARLVRKTSSIHAELLASVNAALALHLGMD